jgi:hypothetical protein
VSPGSGVLRRTQALAAGYRQRIGLGTDTNQEGCDMGNKDKGKEKEKGKKAPEKEDKGKKK